MRTDGQGTNDSNLGQCKTPRRRAAKAQKARLTTSNRGRAGRCCPLCPKWLHRLARKCLIVAMRFRCPSSGANSLGCLYLLPRCPEPPTLSNTQSQCFSQPVLPFPLQLHLSSSPLPALHLGFHRVLASTLGGFKTCQDETPHPDLREQSTA